MSAETLRLVEGHAPDNTVALIAALSVSAKVKGTLGEYPRAIELATRMLEISEAEHGRRSLWAATVTTCGRIRYKRRKINLSTVFAGQKVGIKQVRDKIWLVGFMQYDLGYFDHETCRLEPIENPFSPKVLPMCPEQDVNHVPGQDLKRMVARGRIEPRLENPHSESVGEMFFRA